MPQQSSTRPLWQADNFYKIGKLGKPHGVKGEISFHFDDDIFDR
ncbi:MAG: 16S rRNA processing protein RimM, partial [Prevotella conceptionensis]